MPEKVEVEFPPDEAPERVSLVVIEWHPSENGDDLYGVLQDAAESLAVGGVLYFTLPKHLDGAGIVEQGAALGGVEDLDPARTCVICTGSQGEPRSALTLMGTGDNRWITVGPDDTAEVAQVLADKSVDLRIFRDGDGRTNRSLIDVGGAVLVVSQFTLYGDTRKGRRPSFIYAAPPDLAAELVAVFASAIEARGVEVGQGEFGAEMAVELVNDGPVTIWMDSSTL